MIIFRTLDTKFIDLMQIYYAVLAIYKIEIDYNMK